jgi:hypothetical protein
VYPYEKDEFDDIATTNVSSADLSVPLPTGSIINLGGSYSLGRDLLDTSTVEKQDWGFAQDFGFTIGLSQSLNPWWLHGLKNPYSRLPLIQNTLSKNDYNIAIKTKLFSSVQSYINLRKTERTIIQIQNTLDFYDELLQAYQERRFSGGVSLREYEKIHSEKWEYEDELFNLENNRSMVQEELYRITGTLIENVHNEPILRFDNPVFMRIFMDIRKEQINSLEETSLYLTRESLYMNRIIDRQSNSPGIKVVWGTQYKLPVKPTDSLRDAWEEEKNFNDNNLNNWSLTITLDISPLLSPANHRNTLSYNQETNTINELLKTVDTERKKNKEINILIIQHIEDQIKRLSNILLNEKIRIQEDETLKDEGIITVLDYKQHQLTFTEKETLLLNLQDDLWFYTFISSFIY